jgi:hypothetical protein
VTLRQPILYAEEMWRNQRKWVFALSGLGIAMSAFTVYTRHFVLDANALVWLAYLPFAALFGGLLLYYRWRSHAEVREAGLKVSNLLSSIVIDYDLVRTVRVQPLERHFEEGRKRYIRPISRPLLKKPALFLRLKSDDPRFPPIKRKLGNQLVSDDTMALPIPDPDAMQWEVTSRLPERTGVNLGGQRRRKRAR